MQSIWRLITLSLGLMLYGSQASANTLVREEHLFLPIQVDSHIEKIEVLIVRPVNGEKLPIALIVNGSAADSPSAVRADWLAHIAHDFAHRGWLAASIVWPGYGNSTGKFMNESGNCSSPDVARFLNAHGNELGAALSALRKRPDVDPSLALGVGFSIGGASMLNLASQSDRPLTAVINISGGVYHYTNVGVADSDCSLFQTDVVRNITKFGKDNPTPTLWLYAENDPFFGPNFAERMLAGYRSQGGQADFLMLPPFAKDGHTLYKQEANPLIKPHIDDFLRRNRLPSMDDNALLQLLSELTPANRKIAETYLQLSTEKAMAMPEKASGIYWYYGERSLEIARQKALSNCLKETGKPCRIVAENMELVANWKDLIFQSEK